MSSNDAVWRGYLCDRVGDHGVIFRADRERGGYPELPKRGRVVLLRWDTYYALKDLAETVDAGTQALIEKHDKLRRRRDELEDRVAACEDRMNRAIRELQGEANDEDEPKDDVA